MNLDFSNEELAFRDEVREFLNEELPADIAKRVKECLHVGGEEMLRWQKILAQKGWSAVNWPTEFGGTGWSPTQKYLFASECAVAGAPRIVPFGLSMVGPVIYTFGNDEQKQRFLSCIDEPRKNWKFSAGDVHERGFWKN